MANVFSDVETKPYKVMNPNAMSKVGAGQKTPKVIYLMGPSGSGKDSIITGLKHLAGAASNLLIAHRYVTRDWQAGGENHVELKEDEFQQRKGSGLFSLFWSANGNEYGIGCEVDAWLAAGHSVLINGSRAHLAKAKAHYGQQLLPVLLEVDTDVLRRRLLNRNRESTVEIERRLQRSKMALSELSDCCHVIDNNTQLQQAIVQLVRLINAETNANLNGQR